MTRNSKTVDLPYPDRLSEAGEEEIHEKAITILEEYGMKVGHEEAREMLAENGCDVDGEIVTFPRDLVEKSVEQVPSSFTLHGWGDGQSVDVGDGDYVCMPTGGPPNILRYGEGRRPSTIGDYEDFLKLAHQSDVMTSTGYVICEPNDVVEKTKHLELMQRHLTYSDKTVGGSCYGGDRARACADLVGIANDDPDLSKPYIASIANSVSPRTWDTKMTGGLLAYARRGQPVVISPAVMAAASGPATLAGSMALANAEILAGFTIGQLTNPGTPLVYGLPSSNIDVRYGSFSIGSPEGALFVSFAAQMARYYDVPSRAGGGLTDAKTIDAQLGTEATLQMLTTMQSGVNFVLHAAGVMDSYSTASPEKFILDCDRIRYIEKYMEGYDLDEDSFALDLIGDIDPGGHFLNKRHTLTNSKNFIRPEIYYRDSYDNWTEAGSKDAFESANERVEELLDSYEKPDIDSDIERDIRDYVEEERAAIVE